MESSCFVASKSFAKAAVPVRRRRRWSTSSVVVGSSLRDDGAASAAAAAESPDWRSFRAKLVAGEVGPRTGSGDWWAHALHEPETGCLLVATERLDGVHIFERTVVLLLSAFPVGPPTGIILNRPSLMSIKDAGPADMDPAGTFLGRPLFFGGPREEGVFLARGPGGGALPEVMDGLHYGTHRGVARAGEMVRAGAAAVGDFRFFDGHCGWDGPAQLRAEVRAGYWAVAACSARVIDMDCARLWEDIVGLVWGKGLR
ncbi:PPR containing protein (DUF179) [Wolffia australiana]